MTFGDRLPNPWTFFPGIFSNESMHPNSPKEESSITQGREDNNDIRLRTSTRRCKQHTSNKPSRRTAINVSSFIDSAGFRIAALVFRSAFPKIDRPSCWSLRRMGELPEIINATDEVANDNGESAPVLAYRGNKCSRWPSTLSGWRGMSTKSRKNAQMACCSGKSLNILGMGSLGVYRLATAREGSPPGFTIAHVVETGWLDGAD